MIEYQNWTEKDIQYLKTINSYSEMKEVALKMLKGLPQPVAQVCGPLTTGGRGSFKANLEMFSEGIEILVNKGKTVFDQRPFEIPIQNLKKLTKGSGYQFEVLNDFYLPIFKSGLVKELYFLPGWEGSVGAKWEHEQARLLNIEILYFDKDLIS